MHYQDIWELGIDLETYSETDIKAGVHKYVEDPNFEIILFGYSINKEPAVVIDLKSGEVIPPQILHALTDPQVLKTAYNAAFELAALNASYSLNLLNNNSWSCTMALAAQAGLPFGLDAVAKALKTDAQKDTRGKALIKYFCTPCKPTKANGMRTRNLPSDNYDAWLEFIDYCRQDVVTEQSVRDAVGWFVQSDFEKPVWLLDQKINNNGVAVDMTLVNNAIEIDSIVSKKLIAEMIELTDMKNPKSAAQIKKFILEATGVVVDSLNKASMPDVNKSLESFKDIAPIIKLREKLTRSSIKKYDAIKRSVCADGRVRGLFQYYGAQKTGRWAGRNVQLQNLVRNNLPDLDFARRMVIENKLDVLELTYDDIGKVLSNLIRTAFISRPGTQLIRSDFSAIEARVISWFAGESWRLDVFKTHGKIYEAAASQMFKVPIESISYKQNGKTVEGPNYGLRMKGKIAELALGYQGGENALIKMGALNMGLKENELSGIKIAWRKANPKIVKFWYAVQDAFIEACVNGYAALPHGLRFTRKNNNVIITLPSGRDLVYISAKYIGDRITYYGISQITKQWAIQDTYGGKLVENIVQATARDILTDSLLRIDAAGYDINMHVHDEVVIESIEDACEDITKIMSAPISWAQGLPLSAETLKSTYYQK